MMKDCLAHLRKGNSVFIFPEGSRSEDGHIKPFQSGAFVLAQKAGVPLLPLAVFGSSNALPKKSLIFHGVHHIQVQVLDEINLETVLNRSDEELSHLVQSQILDAFEKMKKTVAKST
jgi:1-acyl-sn-glycerol-3-phosphate acyltransferase